MRQRKTNLIKVFTSEDPATLEKERPSIIVEENPSPEHVIQPYNPDKTPEPVVLFTESDHES